LAVKSQREVVVKGREDTGQPVLLGDYLQRNPEGEYVLLRGKYASCFLHDVPRGYVRNYILRTWKDGMTEEEQELFHHYGHLGLEDATTSDHSPGKAG
jgi:hypothetical protein